MIYRKNPILILVWHFCGLAAATAGAVLLCGWPAALIVLGIWAVLGTMHDTLFEALNR